MIQCILKTVNGTKRNLQYFSDDMGLVVALRIVCWDLLPGMKCAGWVHHSSAASGLSMEN